MKPVSEEEHQAELEFKRKKYAANKDELNAKVRERRRTDPEYAQKRRENQRKNYWAHPEVYREISHRYYTKNREKILAKSRERRLQKKSLENEGGLLK